ncbi:MAG: glycosyltransferase [bacterium]
MAKTWLNLSSFPSNILDLNLKSIGGSFPQVAKAIENASPEGIELLPLERGLFALRREADVIHAPDRLDHVIVENLSRIKRAYESGACLVVLFGVGLGYVVSEAAKHLAKQYSGQARGLLCVEENAASLKAAFSVYDLQRIIEEGHILWATGPDLENQVKTLVETHDLGILEPSQVVVETGRPLAGPSERDSFSRISRVILDSLDSHRQTIRRLREDAAAKYQNQRSQPIQSIWSHGSSNSVWGWITRDAIAGFKDLGLEASMLDMNDGLFTRWFRAQAEFFRRCPDALFFLNHSSRHLAAFCEGFRLPRLIWYVDDPATSVSVPHHSDDFVVCVTPTFHRSLENIGGILLGDVPIAGNAHRPQAPVQERFRSQVSYVGSVRDTSPIRRQLSPSWNEWLDLAVERRVNSPLGSSSEILEAYPPPAEGTSLLLQGIASFVPKSQYMDQRQQIGYYLYIEANSRRRLQFIRALSLMDLAVYGPPDWIRLLPKEMEKCYRGLICTEEDLASVYRSSDITLNINALQGFSFVNMRNFDVPLCGGFLLSEWVPCVPDFFEPGEELAFFDGIDNLASQVKHYLENPEERERISSNARRRIHAEHTYRHRMKDLLDLYYKFQGDRPS